MHRRHFLSASVAGALVLALPFAQAALPEVVVHKSPSCGCCAKWIEHLRTEGFTVRVVEDVDMAQVKQTAGVPREVASCHTGLVAGYFVEGHVPASFVKRLLAEKPAARGIAVPGMPMGSPGMEVPGHEQPYDVMLVSTDGTTTIYGHVAV